MTSQAGRGSLKDGRGAIHNASQQANRPVQERPTGVMNGAPTIPRRLPAKNRTAHSQAEPSQVITRQKIR